MKDKLRELIVNSNHPYFKYKNFSVRCAFRLLRDNGFSAGGKPVVYKALQELKKEGLIGEFANMGRYYKITSN